MSLLTQNITAVKILKRAVDVAGKEWTSKLDINKPFYREYILVDYRDLLLKITAGNWKTVVVDISDSVFYIGLDLKSLLFYNVETKYSKDTVITAVKRKYISDKDILKMFKTTSVEGIESYFEHVEKDKADAERYLSDISYQYQRASTREGSVSKTLLDFYLKTSRYKYLPLVIMGTNSSNELPYYVYYLSSDAYVIKEFKTLEDFNSFLISPKFYKDIASSYYMGIDHLSIVFKGKTYKMSWGVL